MATSLPYPEQPASSATRPEDNGTQAWPFPRLLTPKEARVKIKYLSDALLVEKTRSGKTTQPVLIALFGLALIALALKIGITPGIRDEIESVLGNSSWIFPVVALVGAGLYLIIRSGKTYLRNRDFQKRAFLCSPAEAQGLPDNSLCTITGTIAADQVLDVFGRSDCVMISYKYWDDTAEKHKRATQSSDFYLLEGEERVYVAKDRLRINLPSDSELPSWERPDWVAIVGNAVSVTGVLITRPDGERGFEGEVELSFPVAAYQQDRIRATEDTDSARPAEYGNTGPALFTVLNGHLDPDPGNCKATNAWIKWNNEQLRLRGECGE